MRALFSSLLLLAMGCKSAQQPGAMPERTVLPSVLVDREAATIAGDPDFTVTEWRVDADTLIVGLQYSGGCGPHSFEALFNGAWMKSMPAQGVIHLRHINPENDRCRGLIRQTERFLLRPVRLGDSGEVILRWSGDRGMSASYRY